VESAILFDGIHGRRIALSTLIFGRNRVCNAPLQCGRVRAGIQRGCSVGSSAESDFGCRCATLVRLSGCSHVNAGFEYYSGDRSSNYRKYLINMGARLAHGLLEPVDQVARRLMAFSFSNRVRPTENILIRELEGESVILNLDTESYFGLDDIGTRMWSVLTTTDSVQDSHRLLAKEYDVPEEQLRVDLRVLIEGLIEHGLVKIEDL